MALETASYISQLVSTNPTGSDDRSTADDHLRLLKAVLKTQFPNLTASAVNPTVVEFNLLAGYTGSQLPDFEEVGDWNKQQYFGEATLSDAASISWDLDVAQAAKVTLGGNRTLGAPSNRKAGGAYQLRVIQDGTGNRTLAYNAVFKWPGGSAPSLSTSANAIDIISCVSDGTNMYCTIAQDFS